MFYTVEPHYTAIPACCRLYAFKCMSIYPVTHTHTPSFSAIRQRIQQNIPNTTRSILSTRK